MRGGSSSVYCGSGKRERRLWLARFPDVRLIRQANRGLAVARNVGLAAATGEVVAYTDADCAADPDWLTHLVHRLADTGAAAAGGPNLSPDDGWLAACVAAAPGQPHEMLEPDGGAEHLPGCNMAFDRNALAAVGGFDPRFRTAGDDVDSDEARLAISIQVFGLGDQMFTRIEFGSQCIAVILSHSGQSVFRDLDGSTFDRLRLGILEEDRGAGVLV